MRDDVEAELNTALREEICQHKSLEIAYGRMVVRFSYRLLDRCSYAMVPKLLRSGRRGVIPVETDVSDF